MPKRINDINKLTPEMIKVARLTNALIRAYNLPFAIFETIRTSERQQELFNKGYSNTLKSKHLKGEAFDVVLRIPDWSWDYGRHIKEWNALAYLIQECSKTLLGYKVEWGGDWKKKNRHGKVFKDRPHFQYGGIIAKKTD